jgi:peptide chain release factor subunit 1
VATGLATDVGNRIRRLADTRADEPIFISLYVSLDPAEFPTARERDAQFDSINHELRTQHVVDALSHDSKRSVDEDIERIDRWLRTSLDADGIRGVAIFACASVGVFEVVGTSASLPGSIHVGRTAHLRPLVTAVDSRDWCVFVVDRRNARVLRGDKEGLNEVLKFSDDVHGQHDQGGWSQARFQRSVEQEAKDHIREACERLFTIYKRLPFARLLVACPNELRSEVEANLHPYLMERLAGHIDGDFGYHNTTEISERARPVIDSDERHREAAIVEQLSENLGRGERAAAGLDAVLQTLNEKRVETLLVAPGFTASGAECTRCGWLSTSEGTCPVDGRRLDQTEDVVEAATRAAIMQSADVHVVLYHEPDKALGGPVAALLRF